MLGGQMREAIIKAQMLVQCGDLAIVFERMDWSNAYLVREAIIIA